MRIFLTALLVSTSLLSFGQTQVMSLEECIKTALENNISIKQSNLNRVNSEITKNEAKLDILPGINGQASHGYNWGQTIDPFTNQFASTRVRSNNLRVSANLTLFSGLQKINNIKKAQFDFLAGEADLEKVKNDIALAVANSYLQVLLAQNLVSIAQQQVKSTQLQHNRIEQQVEVGNLAESNLLDIKSQLANDELNLVNQENQLELLKLQLKQLLNIPSTTTIALSDNSAGNINTSLAGFTGPETTFENAVNSMPEIVAAEMRVRSAEKNKAIARGAYLPSINASASYGTGYSGNNKQAIGNPVISGYDTIGITSQDLEAVLIPTFEDRELRTKAFTDQLNDNVNQSLFLTLTVPIFNGNKARYNVKRARINHEIQLLSLQDSKNTLRQDIERAYNDAKSALKSYSANKNAYQASLLAFNNAKLRFEENLINQAEFEDANTRYVSAQNELARAEYTFLFRLKVLQFYNGDLDFSDEE